MKKSGIIFTAKKKPSILGMLFIFVTMLSVLLFAFHQSGFVSSPKAVAQAPNAQNNISIQNMQFMPSQLTVSAGTTVIWTNNESSTPHTTTSDSGLWNSGTLQPGQSFSRTFSTPGTFSYHCNIHPFMHGTIVVTGGTTPSPSPQVTQAPTQTSPMTTSFPPPYPTTYPMSTLSMQPYPMKMQSPKVYPMHPPTQGQIQAIPSPKVPYRLSTTITPPASSIQQFMIIPSTAPSTAAVHTTATSTSINVNVSQNINVQSQTQTQNNVQSVSISISN